VRIKVRLDKFKIHAKIVSVDTETTGLSPWTGDRPYIVSWCWHDEAETRYYVRWGVDPFTRKVTVNQSDVEGLRKFLEDPTTTKVFHNAKFDIGMLDSIGLSVNGRVEDTLFMTKCYHNDLPTYGLKPLTVKLLGMNDDELTDLKRACMKARSIAKKKGHKLSKSVAADYWMVADHKKVAKYAIMDVLRTKRLYEFLEGLYASDDQRFIYEKELKLLHVTYAMEKQGVTLDPKIVQREIDTHKHQSALHYKELCRLGGVKDINVNSKPAMAGLFFDKLKLPCNNFTPTGKQKMTGKLLIQIKHPIIDAYLSYKAAEHALASFFGMFKDESDHTDPENWVLHPNFQQMGAITARFSCKKPNLQNVSAFSEGRSIKPVQARGPFRPKKGYVWYCFDYSQVEVYAAAFLSQERVMMDALLAGRDLHTETANSIWGKGEDIVAKELSTSKSSPSRDRGKVMFFGRIYGMGARAVSLALGCSLNEARGYIKKFSDLYPTLTAYIDDCSDLVERVGYIHNAYGRRLYVDQDASYRAINYKVQGSCADLLKEKMIECSDYFKSKKIGGGLVMTLHDELIFGLPSRFATRTLLLKLKSIMENHHGVFPDVKQLHVKIDKVTSSSSWDKKVRINP